MDFSRQVNQNDYSDTMPPYPARTLAGHVALKGLEAGAVLGLSLTPIVALTRRLPLSLSWSRAMALGPIMGTAATLLLLAGKAYGTDTLDVHGVDDRLVSLQFT